MKEWYTYRWGFVFRTTDQTEYTYVYRWGFVWREPKEQPKPISEWQSYKFHSRVYPGQIIEVDDVMDYVAVGIEPMFIRRRS